MISASSFSVKKFHRVFFCIAGLATGLTLFDCLATDHPVVPSGPVMSTERNSLIDPAEEARNIKRLAKLALDPKSSETVRKSFGDEIAFVERNRKLKDAVVLHLLQEDDKDIDPSLPKVQLARYRDGSTRGLIFIQSDAKNSAKPERIAWVLDPKKEKKEAR